MKHFCDESLNEIMKAAGRIDRTIEILDEIPEAEQLTEIIDQLSAIVAKLDAIVKDEEF